MPAEEHPVSLPLDQTYSRLPITFRYPGFWQLDEQVSETEQTVTLLTEETSFWMISVIADEQDLSAIMESAVAAYADEYGEIDVYEQQEDFIPGWLRVELEFEFQDLINTVCLQVLSTPRYSLLVLYQGHDQDVEEMRATFDAITASVIPG